MTATWGLVTDGKLYAMDGDKYESVLTLKKSPDGDLSIPSQPFNVVIDLNGTAPKPSPIVAQSSPSSRPSDKMNYLWQLDNPVAPYGTCNVTCVAMCLSGYGIVGGGIKGLPEELRTYIEDKQGGDRHECRDLVMGAKWKGVDAEYKDAWTLNEIIAALDDGRPVILNGWFTPSGHFIVLKSFSNDRFTVFDPYGEWFNTGYQTGPELGKNIEYSKNIIIGAGISVSGWADSSSWPKDPFSSPTFSAIIFPKKA
jgi:Peptidase_C39 like family